MALPLPTLTHIQTSLQTAASTSPADVTAATKAAINALVGGQAWTATDAVTGDVVNNPGLLIAAPAGGAIANFRCIVGYADSGTAEPAVAELASPDTTITDGQMLVGFGNEGDDSGGLVNWYDPSPLGTKYFSKLQRALPALTITKVWAVASEETLWVFYRGASDTAIGGFFVGALVEPWSLEALDAEADERLYGVGTLGTAMAGLKTALHTVDTLDIVGCGNTTANNTAARFAIKDPGASSLTVCRIRRFTSTTAFATSATTWTTPANKPILNWNAPEVFKSDGTWNIGRLRGVAFFGDLTCREVVRDTGVDKAIAASYSLAAADDAIIFRAG